MKKILFLSLLIIAVSCKNKKTTETTTESSKPEVKHSTEKKATTNNELLDPTQDLIVVLKNPDITETKELISNSGLKWDKTLLDQDALKIGLIKIPADKKDYWLDKLIQSGEFKHVKLYSEKTLKELIEKEKKTF